MPESKLIGRRLGSYEITAKLGEGGMGEVWRARDTKLERDVAIKVLPAALARDADALGRFEREAKAVAALSHPNILAIFDFGRDGETAYAAMELLDGETLGARLAAGALPPRKALEIAAQVARGLAAAHDRGVVHRDLKPDNLFVTRDGHVKILDFGLARQTGPHGSHSQLLAAPTLAPGTPATAPGAVLGTVGYMAPEQVRGEPADARSDLFALGVVLYEMLTGKRAFARASAVETMSAILTDDPPELDGLAERFSPSVARAVAHALEKRPEERFQTARDFAFELASLAAGGSSSGRGERPAALPGTKPRRGALVAAAALAGAAAIGWFVAMLTVRGATPADGVLRPTFRQLTKLPGGEGQPSLAPDGESFVYVKRDGGDLDLFVQRVDGAKPLALSEECDRDDYDPAFSPDGRLIAFRSECDGGGLFVMGATGESRRKIADFGHWPAWSPDGRELAVVTERLEAPTSRNSGSTLWAVRVDSGERRLVSAHDAMGPTWSPDGRRIAFWGLQGGASFQRDLWSVAADGSQSAESAAVPFVDDVELDWAPVYSRDGRWLYFASTRGGTLNLWRLPLAADGAAAGAPEPVTAPSSSAGPISLSADGERLVFTDRNIESAIVRAPYDPARHALTAAPAVAFSGSFELREQKLSPSGERIVFTNEDAPQHLHVVGVDGGGYRQITEGSERNRQGDWSPDEQWIVFQTTRGESPLALVRPDGGGRQALLVHRGASTPRWAPDGKRLSAFDFSDGGGLWIDVAGGFAAAKVETMPPVEPGTLFWPTSWSSDGRYLAGRATRDGVIHDIVLRDSATGAYRRLAGTAGATNDFNLAFVDRSTVVYTDDWSLWRRGLDDERSTLVYRPSSQRRVESISASADGRWLTWIEKADESDIWLMTLDGGTPPSQGTR